MLRPGDLTLLEVLASLAEHAPERMRATHLADRAREMAKRIGPIVVVEEPDTQNREGSR
jgi:hypothetical protein